MAYIKTEWKNREVERPRTYTMQDNGDGTITLNPAEGTIIEPGTPIIAQNMNKIEDALVVFDEHLDDYAKLANSTSVYNNAHQSIATSVPTFINLNSVNFDDLGIRNNAQPDRLTLKEDGLYLISFNGIWQTNSNGDRTTEIRINNSFDVVLNRQSGMSASVNALAIVKLTAGDYIQIRVEQTSGGSLSFNNSGSISPCLVVCKLK